MSNFNFYDNNLELESYEQNVENQTESNSVSDKIKLFDFKNKVEDFKIDLKKLNSNLNFVDMDNNSELEPDAFEKKFIKSISKKNKYNK